MQSLGKEAGISLRIGRKITGTIPRQNSDFSGSHYWYQCWAEKRQKDFTGWGYGDEVLLDAPADDDALVSPQRRVVWSILYGHHRRRLSLQHGAGLPVTVRHVGLREAFLHILTSTTYDVSKEYALLDLKFLEGRLC